MSHLADARAAVLKALTDAGIQADSIAVQSGVPDVVTFPAVIIRPGTPWATGWTLSGSRVGLTLTCLVSVTGGSEAVLEALETLVGDVLDVARKSWIVGTVGAPEVRRIGNADACLVDVPVTLPMTD